MLNEREDFGKKLKVLRESKGMTQKYLANLLEISPAAYLFYEQGKSEPTIKNLKKLSEIFGVTIDYLLFDIPLSYLNNEESEFNRAVSKWSACDYQVNAESDNRVLINPPNDLTQKLQPLELSSKAAFIDLTKEIERDSKEVELMNFKYLAARILRELEIRQGFNPSDLIDKLVSINMV